MMENDGDGGVEVEQRHSLGGRARLPHSLARSETLTSSSRERARAHSGLCEAVRASEQASLPSCSCR